jgi:monoamine oxidase
MIEPFRQMHFAGEHTRRLDFGMEAALESGERAAFEILERAA